MPAICLVCDGRLPLCCCCSARRLFRFIYALRPKNAATASSAPHIHLYNKLPKKEEKKTKKNWGNKRINACTCICVCCELSMSLSAYWSIFHAITCDMLCTQARTHTHTHRIVSKREAWKNGKSICVTRTRPRSHMKMYTRKKMPHTHT